VIVHELGAADTGLVGAGVELIPAGTLEEESAVPEGDPESVVSDKPGGFESARSAKYTETPTTMMRTNTPTRAPNPVFPLTNLLYGRAFERKTYIVKKRSDTFLGICWIRSMVVGLSAKKPPS
jgi:hypothetical protein